ncbi:hypothetical protein TNCV_1517761 [Trichonephila clavipes]|nr:hypothetical protein TNCV_1517761 [Trichonephila clavipes]
MQRWVMPSIMLHITSVENTSHCSSKVVESVFQERLAQDELYEAWNYPVLKERNHQWLLQKVRHGVSASLCIPLSRQVAIPNDIQVGTSTYAD